MRCFRLVVTLVALLTLSLGAALPGAAQGNSEAAHACKQGGWQEFVVGDNLPLFTNQGDCVSFFAQSGNLACAEAWAYHEVGYAELPGVDLSGCDLSGIHLFSAVLNDATLIGTDFSGAFLQGLNAVDADFTNANLSGANLNSSYLRRANLSGADLTGANLERVDLTGADLTGAIFSNTTCPDGTNSDDNEGSTCLGHLDVS